MKKILIGMVIGIVLMIPMQAFAEDVVNMIGKTVDGTFPFKINGKRVSQDVIVIQGTSYLPVRAAADLFGYDISYDDVNKEVHMQSKKYEGLTDFEKAVKSMQTLSYKVNVDGLKSREGEKLGVLIYNNEIYMPPSPLFLDYIHWDGTTKTITITYNGKTASANLTSSTDGDIIPLSDDFYVKLSAFGLKGTINGDTITIDKAP